MSEAEWATFFTLLNKVVNNEGIDATAVNAAAEANEADDDLEEFLALFEE